MTPTLPAFRTSTIRSLSLLSTLFTTASSSKKAPPTMDTPQPPDYHVRPYVPRNPAGPFPHTKADLTPMDTSSDHSFYTIPRFVTHIDDNAIENLKGYYDICLPKPPPQAQLDSPTPSRPPRILDFCSSWISHYPSRFQHAVQTGNTIVLGTGMNKSELAANPLLNLAAATDASGAKQQAPRWTTQDLNQDPDVRLPDDGVSVSASGADRDEKLLDAATCTVSIDYLTRPVEVLASIRRQTRPGGAVHLAISNRCFPTKAVGRWLKVAEPDRLAMVGDYLWWSGWRDIEVVEVVKPSRGWGGNDPLWVVRAKNTGDRPSEVEGGGAGGG